MSEMPDRYPEDLPGDPEPSHQRPGALDSSDAFDLLADQEPLFNPGDTPVRGTSLQASAAKTPPRGISRADMPIHVQPKTNPSLRIRATPPDSTAGGSRWLSLAMLLIAGILTLIAGLIYLDQNQNGVGVLPTPTRIVDNAVENPTRVPPTAPPQVAPPTATPSPIPPTPIPVRSLADTSVPPDVVAELLLHPGVSAPPPDGFYRMQNAFTIAPVRSRSKVTSYVIQPGDTIERIAERFGVSVDTIIWNNDGIYVNRLLPGDSLIVLPESGVLHKTVGEETIQAIADRYKVSPFTIIDSEYNPHLQRAKPSTLLTPGIEVIVPGGVSEKKAIYWNPGISFGTEEGGSSGGGSSGGGSTASFGGGPGSCGSQPNTGGSGSFVVPLPPVYTVFRGFTAYHSGIDLAAPTGTTVFAADGGTVIFAGWSNWGYGYAVVLAHGRFLTLYGHMSSIAVSCGQAVSRGTPLGAVGSSGNSSGPHLHFEIRIGETPDNPESYLVF